jgi:restriction system protein
MRQIQMSPEQKCIALRKLAKKRRQDNLEGHCRLSDFHAGYYECCFVSPWSKSAHNIDAEIMLLGQDWSSSDSLSRSRDPKMRKLGQSWNLPTNANLRAFLDQNLNLDFSDTFATNVFPFIKKGPMNARIRIVDLLYCAREYALPQMEIVSPKMAICLGRSAFEAIQRLLGAERKPFTDACKPKHCINYRGIEIYGVPHPGSFGVRNAGGKNKVHERWRVLGERLLELQNA